MSSISPVKLAKERLSRFDYFYHKCTKGYATEWVSFHFNWNTKSPLFSDKRVRQAMGLAFDHQELLTKLRYGLDAPCTGIFHPQWMKMLTFATIVGLIYHVWVGMRDVLMDYVKPVGIRLVLQMLVIVWLVGCAGWAIQVLWRV